MNHPSITVFDYQCPFCDRDNSFSLIVGTDDLIGPSLCEGCGYPLRTSEVLSSAPDTQDEEQP